MHLHLVFLAYGLADWLVSLLLPPVRVDQPRSHHASAPRPIVRAWALLLLCAGVLVCSLVLPLLLPAAATFLQPAGAKGFLLLAGALLAATVLLAAGRLSSFVRACHRTGREIHEGTRRPAWRR